MPKKRKLHPSELRLVVASHRLKANGTLRHKTYVHVARETISGKIIRACTEREQDLLRYYYFPFIRFIYDVAPMCTACVQKLTGEGISPPLSNTGVNSRVEGENDDAQ